MTIVLILINVNLYLDLHFEVGGLGLTETFRHALLMDYVLSHNFCPFRALEVREAAPRPSPSDLP